MNMNDHQTTRLKTPEQFTRVNTIIASFREVLKKANVKAAQAERDNKPFVTMRLADKTGAFTNVETPSFQPALQRMQGA